MEEQTLTLEAVPGDFAIAKIREPASVDWKGVFVSLTCSRGVLSLVAERSALPPDASPVSTGWAILRVKGTMPFTLVGILARITKALAAGGVALNAISSYDTDFIMVKQNVLTQAINALRAAGISVDHA